MNRTTRTVVVICIATILAAIGTLGVYAAVQRMPVQEVEAPHAMVAVAAESLPTGTPLTEEHVKMIEWPARSVPPGSFSSAAALVNRGLIASVVENEPLLESKLAQAGAGAGLGPMVPKGMRAMSVRVDDGSGVAGFVVPGARVDVLVTFRGVASTSAEPSARTVLSNVLVLTSGTRLDQQASPQAAAGSSTVVTLALTPADAERIALATTEGRISLSLRNPFDRTPTESFGIGVDELMRGAPKPEPPPVARPVRRIPPPPPKPEPKPEPEPEPEPITVETIRGAERTTDTVE